VTGKSVGSVDMVMASDEVDGDCWARQEEMLFTVVVSMSRSRLYWERAD
jgi:hypothetical protein